MARIAARELFRIRNAVLGHHSPPTRYSSAFPYIEDRPISIYHPSVELLGSCRNTRHLSQVQAQLITCGLFPFWSAKLLRHASDFGNIEYTVLIFRYIDSPGIICVNNVIRACSLSSIPHRGVVFYFEMLRNGFTPNSFTFVSLFGSCAKMGCVESGQKCHGQAVKNGVDCVLPVQNSLLHMYGCCGIMECAGKVFEEMSQPDLVSWNSIVDGFVRVGETSVAHQLFDVMPQRNVVSWNIMINGFLKANNPGCALKQFREMMKSGLRGNDSTMVSMLTACARSARVKEGRSIHGFLVRACSNLSTILYTSLIDMYSKCQKVEVAQKLFDNTVHRNLVCWNAMILGHCIHGNPEDGLNLFAEMVDWAQSDDAILPDEVTFIGVLCACARAELLKEGRNFFCQMTSKYNIKPNFAHYWCMANLYVGAGLIEDAEILLRNMPNHDEDVSSESFVWANLLRLCRFQANATLGEKIANLMIDKEPHNFSHYKLLLNVYAAAGQWDDVARVKKSVEEKMGRTPGCSLLDLKEIVHEHKVGKERMGEIKMMIARKTGKRLS